MIRVVLVDGERHEFPTPAWRTSYADGFLDVYRVEGPVSTTVETWKVPLRRVHWIQEVSSGVTPAFTPDAYGDAAGDAAQFRKALALIAGNAILDPVALATLVSTRFVPEGTDR